MNIQRKLNLLAEIYTQTIYEWPNKPSKVLANSILWMYWQVEVIKHQTNRINMNLTFRCKYRIDKKMKI